MIPSIRVQYRFRFTLSVLLLLSVLLTRLATASELKAGNALSTEDCGAVALYYLLSLEGRPTDLTKVMERLDKPHPDGYSMDDLRVAADRSRLKLVGVSLRDTLVTLDRPAIVLVRREGRGHYLVIRPVGHTGNLVQIIDWDRPPEIIDATRLMASPQWTGFALIPSRSNMVARMVGIAAIVCTTTAAFFLFASYKRRLAAL